MIKMLRETTRVICVYLLLVASRFSVTQSVVDNGVVAYPPLQQFNPAVRNTANFRGETVTAYSSERAGHFIINSMWNKRRAQTVLPPEVGQINQMILSIDNRLVVVAMVNGSGSEIIIIDSTGSIADKFLCYLPAVSPDRRYIAFTEFYPAHFGENTTDKYLLYDLAKSPLANRDEGVSRAEWVRVGKAVLPQIDVGESSDKSQPLSQTHYSASRPFWSPEGEEYILLDRTSAGYQLLRIALLPPSEGERITVSSVHVPTTEMCPSEKSTTSQSSTCQILMRHLTFGRSDEVVSAELQVVPDHSYLLNVTEGEFSAYRIH